MVVNSIYDSCKKAMIQPQKEKSQYFKIWKKEKQTQIQMWFHEALDPSEIRTAWNGTQAEAIPPSTLAPRAVAVTFQHLLIMKSTIRNREDRWHEAAANPQSATAPLGQHSAARESCSADHSSSAMHARTHARKHAHKNFCGTFSAQYC